ncbi:MAG: acetyl-CoA carboxylase biotin carboxyl carrier protein [Candidatus Aminicenantes bacterium]|nr:acetyl-CoA carboxylase biotin carboxyl carrier protein [Candidatus Aminicenantes bacterium]
MRIKDLELENLLELLKKYELSELTLKEGRTSISMKRDVQPLPYISQSLPGIDSVAPQPAVQPKAAVAGSAGAAPPNPAGWHEVKAPLVGTFYRCPSPDAEPFVEEGDQVQVNDKLCIVEAMKIMNEIESPVAGIVKQVCVKNGKPIEFGQVLFRIEVAGAKK